MFHISGICIPGSLSVTFGKNSQIIPYFFYKCLPCITILPLQPTVFLAKVSPTDMRTVYFLTSYLRSGWELFWLFLFGRVEENALAPSHQMELHISFAFAQLLNYRCELWSICILYLEQAINRWQGWLNNACMEAYSVDQVWSSFSW